MRNIYTYLFISSLLLISCSSLSTTYVNKHTGHTMEKINIKKAQRIVRKIRKDESSFISPTDFLKKINKKNYALIISGSIGGGMSNTISTKYIRIDNNSGEIDDFFFFNNRYGKREMSLNNPFTITKLFSSNGIQTNIETHYNCGAILSLDSLGYIKCPRGASISVGYSYTYDFKGNIVNKINHDLGYPITPIKIEKIIKEKYNISKTEIVSLSRYPYVSAKFHFQDYYKDTTNLNHNIWIVNLNGRRAYNMILIDAQNGSIISKHLTTSICDTPEMSVLEVNITSIISLSQQSNTQSDSTKVKIKNKKDLIDKIERSKEKTVIDSILVKGVIKDHKNLLSGATILRLGTTSETKTDIDGQFEIILTIKNENESIELRISYRGIESKEIEIYAKKGNKVPKYDVIYDR